MDFSKFLRREEVAMLAGVSTRMIDILVAQGRCPTPIRVGKIALFREEEITSWLPTYTPKGWGRRGKARSKDRVAAE